MTLDQAIGHCNEVAKEIVNTEEEVENIYNNRYEAEATDVQPKATCRMIPLEPDCRGYTDVFICTHCHQHIHLGFIRKEYSGNFCIECGAEIKDSEHD